MATKPTSKKQTGEAEEFTPEQKARLRGLSQELETRLEDYKEELEGIIMHHIRFAPHGKPNRRAPKS